MHDFRLFKKESIFDSIPEDITNWLDKGFYGLKNLRPNLQVMIPHKKTPKSKLTEDQKAENKIIGGLRIVIENTICGIKRLGTVSQRYRNKGNRRADTLMLLAAGLWNLHVTMGHNLIS